MMPSSPSKPPALWPFLVVCAAGAVWIDLGSLHQYENADTLIPILVSLYRWTPFFWEQDRYGMLLPLLTTLIKDPFLNLVIQEGMAVFCGLAAMFLLARYVLRDKTYPIVASFTVVAFLVVAPSWHRFVYLVDTCYGVAFALGLGGLQLADAPPKGRLVGWRRLLALALILLAHWVYQAVILVLAPLVVLRFMPTRGSRAGSVSDGPTPDRPLTPVSTGFPLLSLLAGAGFGMLLARCAPVLHTTFTPVPPAQWLTGWRQLIGHLWTALAPHSWPLFVGLTAGTGALSLCIPAVRRHGKAGARAAAVLLAAALPHFLIMGTQKHVQLNDYEVRYVVPAVFVLQMGLATLALAPMLACLGDRPLRCLHVATAPVVLLAAAIGYGYPSPAVVRADLKQALGSHTDDVLASGCTHVAGDYWMVWATVYDANLVLHDRGERRIVWGIAERSGPTRRLWKQVPPEKLSIAIPPGGDAATHFFLVHYGFPPMAVVEKRATVWVLRPMEHVARLFPGFQVGDKVPEF
jgi:hypothetical protein